MKMNRVFVTLLAGLLVTAMLLTFVGCGEDVESESDPISGDSETETVENTDSESETEGATETEDNGEVTFPRDEF